MRILVSEVFSLELLRTQLTFIYQHYSSIYWKSVCCVLMSRIKAGVLPRGKPLRQEAVQEPR